MGAFGPSPFSPLLRGGWGWPRRTGKGLSLSLRLWLPNSCPAPPRFAGRSRPPPLHPRAPLAHFLQSVCHITDLKKVGLTDSDVIY